LSGAPSGGHGGPRGPGGNGSVDVEWVAVQAGLKPANRITIEPQRAGDVELRARRAGFHVERGPKLVEFPGRPPAMILYISPERDRARELVAAETQLLPPGRPMPIEDSVHWNTRVGELLGFPRCCVEEFAVRLRRSVTRRLDGGDAHEDFVAAECAARASRRLLGRLNDLSPDRRARIVTFYPCRYDCPSAAGYAAAVFAAAEGALPAAAAALRAALLGTMSIAVDGSRGVAHAGLETLTLEFAEF